MLIIIDSGKMPAERPYIGLGRIIYCSDQILHIEN
jgi:hypothetical protein